MRAYQLYNTGDDGDKDAYDVNWLGQTFTPEVAHIVGKVKLKLFKVGSPGVIIVSIRATSGGEPAGADLCAGSIVDTNITTDTNGDWYEITLGDGFEVEASTQYAIIIRATEGDASNKISWRTDGSTPTYEGGLQVGSSDSGVGWDTYSGVDCMFEEWGVGPPNATTITWGNLPKSQISSEKIETAIDRLIQAHEDDPDAHLEENESLYSHKAAEIIDHIASSIIADKIKDDEVWERHRHSISAWKRLLEARPDEALKILKSVWTAGTGENNVLSITFDGTYIYVGLYISPAKVIKIDPATMTEVATWTGATGENNLMDLTFDGTYIYATLYIEPAKVIKIDPSDMSTNDTWTGAEGENNGGGLTFDGTYIYASLATEPAKVIKITISTMATADTWTGAEGENSPRRLTFDGLYIYVGLCLTPSKVIKIDTSDMSTNDTWTGAENEDNLFDINFDGTYIYAGLSITPAKVIKIDPSDMSTNDTWTGAGGENACTCITFDGTYIYAGLFLEPAEIIKINPSTMATISKWTGGSGENNAYSLTFDGTYLFMGLYLSPTKLIRKIMRDINETGT